MSIQSFDPSNNAPINPDTGLSDPANVIRLTPTAPGPGIILPTLGVFGLSGEGDQVELTAGVLADIPHGLAAFDGDDFVKGSEAPEEINGNAGNDCVLGGGGDDTLHGGKNFDVVAGGIGNDLLFGDKGSDYVFGNEGDDSIFGGQDEDNLVGNAGNDTLTGDLGIDKLWGGSGADVLILRRDTAAPPKVVGSAVEPPADSFPTPEEITADFILDYKSAEGDRIGLTGGLTTNDITLTERFLTFGDRRDYDPSGPFQLGVIRTADFQIETTKVTVITETSTGNILGLVKNASPQELQFISIPDNAI